MDRKLTQIAFDSYIYHLLKCFLFCFKSKIKKCMTTCLLILGTDSRSDCSVVLKLLLHWIYAGLEICEWFCISNSNLVFLLFDPIFFSIFRSWNASKMVNQFISQASSLKPVCGMLLLGIIFCGLIIWLFCLLYGGLRPTLVLVFNITPDELKYQFLIATYHSAEILIFLAIFLFLFVLFYKKVVNYNRKNRK